MGQNYTRISVFRKNLFPPQAISKNTFDAEVLISKVLIDKKYDFNLGENIPSGTKGTIVLDGSFARQTGISVSRGSTEAKSCCKVRIVLRFEYWHGKPYFILTAYPMV